MRGAARHGNAEGAARAGRARHADRAAVSLDELLHERQADAGALVAAGARVAGAVEALEEPRLILGRDADAGVLHGQHDQRAFQGQAHTDLALGRELEGVRQQIEDDLLPEVAADVDRLGQRRAIHGEAQPGALDRCAEAARQIAREGGQIDRRVGGVEPPGLDAREVEERVDQLEQAQGVAVRDEQALVGLRIERRLGQQILQGPEQQGQRGAELVADVAEEDGLGAIERGKRFGAGLGVLVGLRVAECGGNLRADQVEKAPVAVVERVAGADSGDEQRRGLGLPRLGHGQDNGGVGLQRIGGGEQAAEAGGEVGHARGGAARDDVAERPGGCLGAVRRAYVDLLRRRRAAGGQAHGRRQVGGLAAGVEAVEQGEGQIGRILAQGAEGRVGGIGHGVSRAGAGGQVAQRAQPARADHALGRLGHRREDPAHAARLVADGAVGEGEVALLGVAVALEQQQLVV